MFLRVVFLAFCLTLVSSEHHTNEKHTHDDQASPNDEPIVDVPEINVNDAAKVEDDEDKEVGTESSDKMEFDTEADQELDNNEDMVKEIKDAKPFVRSFINLFNRRRRDVRRRRRFLWGGRRRYGWNVGKKDATMKKSLEMADSGDEDEGTVEEMQDAKPWFYGRRRGGRRRYGYGKKDATMKKSLEMADLGDEDEGTLEEIQDAKPWYDRRRRHGRRRRRRWGKKDTKSKQDSRL